MPRKSGKKKGPAQPPPRRPADTPSLPAAANPVSPHPGDAAAAKDAAPAATVTAAMGALNLAGIPKEKQAEVPHQKMPLRENVQSTPGGPRGRGRGQPPPPTAAVAKLPGLKVDVGALQPEPPPVLAQKLEMPPSKDILPQEPSPAPVAIELKGPPPTSSVCVPRPSYVADQGAPLLYTNLYPLEISLKEVYHYDVEITRLVEDKGQKQRDPKRAKQLPSTLTRPLFEEAVKSNEKFFTTDNIPVFDGNRNVYTKKPLALNADSVKIISFPYTEVVGGHPKPGNFTLTIQPAARQREYEEYLKYGNKTKQKSNVQHVVDLEFINDFYSNKSIKQIPQECLAAIGTILRHSPSLGTIPVKHGFFIKDKHEKLPEGLQLWFGYNFAVHVGRDRLYLNFDRGFATFYPPGPLLDFASAFFRMPPGKLTPRHFQGLQKKFSKIKIYSSHIQRVYTIWKISDKDCHSQTFEKDGHSISVAKYFFDVYKKKLRFPNLPPVNCGSPGKDTFLPMELCEIKEDQPHFGEVSKEQQSKIILFSAVPPSERFKIIQENLKEMKVMSKETLSFFGIKIGDQMLQVPGPVQRVPQLQFKEWDHKQKALAERLVSPDDQGSWKTFGFFKGTTLKKWVLISFADLNEVNQLIESLINFGKQFNMIINTPLVIWESNDSEAGVQKALENCKEEQNLQLIFVVLSNNINKAFLKYKGDHDAHVPTVCARWTNVRKSCSNKMFIGNLLLKINLKLGGSNFVLATKTTPSIMKTELIVIGINVTHRGPRDKRQSYAAVVANIDFNFNQYKEEVAALQSHQNILISLRGMLKNLFIKFSKNTKVIPKRVIVYRDGVGDGQYPEVKLNELPIIKEAYHLAYPNVQVSPAITLAIGLRRNGIRFMPVNPNAGTKNGNIRPGTVVDKISSPYEFEFFLCSHLGIKGTSAPTKYSVLHDDNNFAPHHFASLTFVLSHLYTRCTRSISSPSVMKTAQHYALRGKDCMMYMELDEEEEEDEGGF